MNNFFFYIFLKEKLIEKIRNLLKFLKRRNVEEHTKEYNIEEYIGTMQTGLQLGFTQEVIIQERVSVSDIEKLIALKKRIWR